MATEEQVQKIARSYAKQLAKNIGVKNLILTGSWANGSYLEDSDVDLIVVSDDFARMQFHERLVFLQKFWKSRIPLEAFGYTTSEFQKLRKSSSYVKDAVKHGLSLVP